MSSLRALKIFGLAVVAILLGIAALNYAVDAQCYYRCKSVDVKTRTLNQYYLIAQRILAYPETELIFLGSSRGETVSPVWLEKESGLKTLNLSLGAADFQAKSTFLNFASQNTKLKRVVWLADYFELMTENADAKLRNTPALEEYFDESLKSQSSGESGIISLPGLQTLIDHKSLQSSISYLAKAGRPVEFDKGLGSSIDYDNCRRDDYQGTVTPEKLKKEIDLIFEHWTRGVIRHKVNDELFEQFKNNLLSLKQKGVEPTVVIGPYHKEFMRRLKAEQPSIFDGHQKWLSLMVGLNNDGIQVLNYFDGIESDNGSTAYWSDGVHFTCRYSHWMLSDMIGTWRK